MVTRHEFVSTILVLFLNVNSGVYEAASHGRRITCACTTLECKSHGTDTCLTASVCFTQYLDREDGQDPLMRGCIDSRTPLLCQNQRPAVRAKASWPVLLCCNRTMCNTQRSLHLLFSTVKPDTESNKMSSDDDWQTTQSYGTLQERTVQNKRLVGLLAKPVHAILLVVGVAILVVVTVSGVAACIIRRRHSMPAYGWRRLFRIKTATDDDSSCCRLSS